MSCAPAIEKRVLSIDPTHRGFGYVVLEGSDLLVDWGQRNIRGVKNAGSVVAVARLIELYQPDALVVEDPSSADCRRWPRVQLLIRELTGQAARMNISARRISRAKVRKTFAASGASTKYEIARAIASRFPELAPRLPPERQPWMSEDTRMAIFDAAAFALTFFSGANHASAARKKSQIVQ
jgi:hypothetical protein